MIKCVVMYVKLHRETKHKFYDQNTLPIKLHSSAHNYTKWNTHTTAVMLCVYFPICSCLHEFHSSTRDCSPAYKNHTASSVAISDKHKAKFNCYCDNMCGLETTIFSWSYSSNFLKINKEQISFHASHYNHKFQFSPKTETQLEEHKIF